MARPLVAQVNLGEVMDPSRFIGLAPRQARRFVVEHIQAVRKRYGAALKSVVDLKV